MSANKRPNYGKIRLSLSFEAWRKKNGLFEDEINHLVQNHIEGLEANGHANATGAATMQNFPGTSDLILTVIKVRGGYLIKLLSELKPGELKQNVRRPSKRR